MLAYYICSEPNVPRLMVGYAGSLRLRSPRQLADDLLFSLFALHCGIFALVVPWHVGEVRRLFQCVLFLSRVATC
jgi:hypothetical protein